ncbi:MAG: bifunctional UDP-sugar hydrolase/5'-nucleotidase [Clostridia bacterium]
MAHLRILFTTDMHGYFLPTDYVNPGERQLGLAKLMAAFPQGEDTLVIDGGDTLQGSPFTDYVSRQPMKDSPCAKAMNLGGYDYITLGNHDFNQGMEALARYLRALDARCLCCNIRDRAGALPILPYVIHTMPNGLRVGLTGACTHHVLRWERREMLEQLEIEPPVPALGRALAQMRGKCDVTVCIYHGGFECDLQTGERLTDSDENQACEIAEKLGFDILLTGHQHMAVEGVRLGATYAVQAAYRAPHFIQLDAEVTPQGVQVSSRLMPPAAEADARVTALLSGYEAQVQRWLDTPIGRLDRSLPPGGHLEMAVNGCAIANFVNQVQLRVSGADLSTTALANDYPGIGQEVTVRGIVSAYIYSNTLVVLRMTGAVLKRYAERCAEYFTLDEGGQLAISDRFLRPKQEHYNYDYFSGMEYAIDPRRALGDRVTRMSRGGRPIAPKDVLTVCVSSYRASGTGGYDMLCGLEVVQDIQRDVAELLIEYVEQQKLVCVDAHRYLTVEGSAQ